MQDEKDGNQPIIEIQIKGSCMSVIIIVLLAQNLDLVDILLNTVFEDYFIISNVL